MKTHIISLGGSIIMPKEIDVLFLRRLKDYLLKSQDQFILICGGGSTARVYQKSALEISDVSDEDLDWIGIRATKLNAELVRSIFGKYSYDRVISDPDGDYYPDKRIIIASGFRPGSSTDLRAVQYALKFNSNKVINMSNIDYIYSGDPKKDKDVYEIKNMKWDDLLSIIGENWRPGMNTPFDPIAAKKAKNNNVKLYSIGKDLDNLFNLIEGKEFIGTIVD
jgi:uridylate kinase